MTVATPTPVWRLRGWKLYVLLALPMAWILAYGLSFRSEVASFSPVPTTPAHSHDSGLHIQGGKQSSPSAARKRQAIKPIAYIFPQFHPIPENDKFWGVNFTEWDNVRKVTKNAHGLETVRPTEEVGYYNLLDYSTRLRQRKFLKESGFYGIAYHHYWFGDRPVMERVLTSMLEDSEPNMPFMLNWANEPWTARWDGNDNSKVLMAQDYGTVETWRRHYDWLKQFFRHPNYIRVNGRVQFMIYNPSHMGDLGPRMFMAWRKWAEEDGIGGLDVVETKVDVDGGFGGRGTPDAASEFAPRSGGFLDTAEWVANQRWGRVYHRGGAVCWDNTPRHVSDGGASVNPFCHYKLWKYSMVELMRRAKLEPNPFGEENFFFINALNEWGEGNVLEPSLQWGDGYGKAFKEAYDIAAQLPWVDDVIEEGEQLGDELSDSAYGINDIDVCVVIRERGTDWNRYDNPFRLQQMLRSLKAQNNKNWRAVVFDAGGADMNTLQKSVWDTYDPRIKIIPIPEITRKVDEEKHAHGDWITDWVLGGLNKTDPACAGARYLLVANGDYTYHQTTFDVLAHETVGDLVGLRFANRQGMKYAERPTIPWHQRCNRFEDGSTQLCHNNTLRSPLFDLGAIFISQAKFRDDGAKLSAGYATVTPGPFASHQANRLVIHKLVEEKGWIWEVPLFSTDACHAVEGHTYTSCLKTGRFWVDAAEGADCHSLGSITGKFSWDTSIWDLKRFREEPFCLRHSEKKYKELMKEATTVSAVL